MGESQFTGEVATPTRILMEGFTRSSACHVSILVRPYIHLSKRISGTKTLQDGSTEPETIWAFMYAAKVSPRPQVGFVNCLCLTIPSGCSYALVYLPSWVVNGWITFHYLCISFLFLIYLFFLFCLLITENSSFTAPVQFPLKERHLQLIL